jgi:hypothetical protein
MQALSRVHRGASTRDRTEGVRCRGRDLVGRELGQGGGDAGRRPRQRTAGDGVTQSWWRWQVLVREPRWALIELDAGGIQTGQAIARGRERAFRFGVVGLEQMVDGVRSLPDDEGEQQQRGEGATNDGQRANSLHGGGRIPGAPAVSK